MSESQRARSQFDIEPHVGRKLDEVEKDLILGTLARCGGNRTWAADILGISIRTLRNKMLQYNGAAEIPAKPGRRTKTQEEAHMSVLEAFSTSTRVPS